MRSAFFISRITRAVLRGGVVCLIVGAGTALAAAGWSPGPQQSVPEQRLPGQKVSNKAAVEGIVRGANEKAIPGAHVELKNTSTQVTLTTASNAQGVFRFVSVPPGLYDLVVRSAGYKDFSNPEIQLKAGDDVVCQVALQQVPVAELPPTPRRFLSYLPEI